MRFQLIHIFIAMKSIMTFIAMILMLDGLGSSRPDLVPAGLSLHVISFALELLSSTLPFRYLSGMNKLENRSWYALKAYITWTFYGCTIVAFFASIGVQQKTNLPSINLCAVGIIIYYLSFMLVGACTLVVKPTCPFSEVNIDRPFYQNDGWIDTGASLAVMFIVSFIVLNASFGAYYMDVRCLYTLVGCSLAGIAGSLGLQMYRFIVEILPKGLGTPIDRSTVSFKAWISVILMSSIATIACFIYALTSWTLDQDYMITSRQMRAFYLCQAAFPFIFLLTWLVKLAIRAIRDRGTSPVSSIEDSNRAH